MAFCRSFERTVWSIAWWEKTTKMQKMLKSMRHMQLNLLIPRVPITETLLILQSQPDTRVTFCSNILEILTGNLSKVG